VPTYQYACTECGHRFEAVQSFTDDALTDCPQCTGRLRKVFNSVGIVFKGSGFYRTDSREKPKGDATTDTKADSKTDAGAGTGSGDSAAKPAAATPASPNGSSAKPASASTTSPSTAGSAA